MMTKPQARIIPSKGSWPDVARDAPAIFNVLKDGGVCIVPTDVGYGIVSCSAEGIERAFQAKKRKPSHTLGIVGNWKQHVEIHNLPQQSYDMSRVLTQEELGTMLGIVAPYRKDNPRMQRLSAQTLERVTKGDTVAIAIIESPLLREVSKLNDEDGQLMIGSSANLTGQGQKFRVEDIEDEVLEAADLIVDYGLQKMYRYGRAVSIITMPEIKVVRVGCAYELLRLRLKRWFDIDIPEDPEFPTDNVGAGKSIKTELAAWKGYNGPS